ncbi:MAG TPA: precorrin-6y C5,15-methyltransferase (decarboxylating) subunit CbiE [Anaeromyxobacter sp.]
MRRAVTIVGIGADGCAGLSSRAAGAVAAARVLAGGARHLAFFPQFAGERITLDSDLGRALDRVAELADEAPVCVLASGDPLFFGIGARLLERIPVEDVELLPHPSSVQWAFARAGLPWDDASFLSLHGRGREGLAARVRREHKAALLTDGAHAPPAIARHLIEHGARDLRAILCEDLGGPGERVRRYALDELASLEDVRPLNVVLLVRPDGWRPPPVIPFLPDDLFEKRRGLITKREVRLLALGALALREDSVVWDVGAGSGSVAIEAALVACEGRTHAVEADPECVEHCRHNARTHGADNVRVVAGRAPEALGGLETPDAVFVGGSGGELASILEVAAGRLAPGGRLVVSAVTFETLEEARRALGVLGLGHEITLASLARSSPIAGRTRLEPLSPVHLLCATKPAGGAR